MMPATRPVRAPSNTIAPTSRPRPAPTARSRASWRIRWVKTIRNVDEATIAAAITAITTKVASSTKTYSTSLTACIASVLRTVAASATSMPAVSPPSAWETAAVRSSAEVSGAARRSIREKPCLRMPATTRSGAYRMSPLSTGASTTPVTTVGLAPLSASVDRSRVLVPTCRPIRSTVRAVTATSPGASG
jgi:hypothetical protein